MAAAGGPAEGEKMAAGTADGNRTWVMIFRIEGPAPTTQQQLS